MLLTALCADNLNQWNKGDKPARGSGGEWGATSLEVSRILGLNHVALIYVKSKQDFRWCSCFYSNTVSALENHTGCSQSNPLYRQGPILSCSSRNICSCAIVRHPRNELQSIIALLKMANPAVDKFQLYRVHETFCYNLPSCKIL